MILCNDLCRIVMKWMEPCGSSYGNFIGLKCFTFSLTHGNTTHFSNTQTNLKIMFLN